MLLTASGGKMRRGSNTAQREKRIDVRLPATLIDSDGIASSVTILDLSSGGFRVEFSGDHLRIGEHVVFRTSRLGDMPAEIRWVLGREAGGVFLQPPKLG